MNRKSTKQPSKLQILARRQNAVLRDVAMLDATISRILWEVDKLNQSFGSSKYIAELQYAGLKKLAEVRDTKTKEGWLKEAFKAQRDLVREKMKEQREEQERENSNEQ